MKVRTLARKPFGAIAGDEILAMHEVVDLAIAHVLAGTQRQQRHDLELGEGEFELALAPGGAVDVEAQLELARRGPSRRVRRSGSGSGAQPVADEIEALHQDRQPARLVDEIDRAASQGRFLVDVVAQNREEDDRRVRAGLAQAAQHLEPVHPRHAPVEQDHVRGAAALEMVERGRAAAETVDGEALVEQVEAERFAERIVVVNEDDPSFRSALEYGLAMSSS